MSTTPDQKTYLAIFVAIVAVIAVLAYISSKGRCPPDIDKDDDGAVAGAGYGDGEASAVPGCFTGNYCQPSAEAF